MRIINKLEKFDKKKWINKCLRCGNQHRFNLINEVKQYVEKMLKKICCWDTFRFWKEYGLNFVISSYDKPVWIIPWKEMESIEKSTHKRKLGIWLKSFEKIVGPRIWHYIKKLSWDKVGTQKKLN